jgi:membrane-associated phospholipid phosphatase
MKKKVFPSMISAYTKKSLLEIMRDFTAFGSPLLLGFIVLLFFGLRMYTLSIFVAMILIEVLAAVIKLAVPKDRPNKEEYSNILEKIDAGSFPSVHSARSLYFALLLFLVIPTHIAPLAFLIPLIVGYTRIKMGKHFGMDVLGGFVLGFIVFTLWELFLLPLA